MKPVNSQNRMLLRYGKAKMGIANKLAIGKAAKDIRIIELLELYSSIA